MSHPGGEGRLAQSAAVRVGPLGTMEQVWDWWTALPRRGAYEVETVPFRRLGEWAFTSEGNLVHASGGFFSVQGLRVTGDGPPRTQPIINQPEVGILGILVKEFDGVLHCLMQAKFEPGNLDIRQLSPTVQATRSNYMRVHNGRATPYVEFFRSPPRDRVLVDVLQSEQGAWFWRKRNRNMVVEADGDVPEREGFRWLTLNQVLRLLYSDNVVNMDARTVLASLALHPGRDDAPAADSPLRQALLRSYRSQDVEGGAVHTLRQVIGWFTDVKVRCAWDRALLPLSQVTGWTRTEQEIADDARQEFRILGVQVRASGREVRQWTQPLLAPFGQGTAVFLTRTFGGVLHVLAAARPEPGLSDLVEIAPTVHCRTPAAAAAQPFAGAALAEAPERTHCDVVLSEEGGRFRHALTRYRILDAGPEVPDLPPDGYCWVTAGQLTELARHANYLNIEARTLLTCLYGMWAGAAPGPGAR